MNFFIIFIKRTLEKLFNYDCLPYIVVAVFQIDKMYKLFMQCHLKLRNKTFETELQYPLRCKGKYCGRLGFITALKYPRVGIIRYISW
jgi:hypothetical protein